ncbi:hypothetical protein [Saccharothrix sp. Mg75]|uniref:hypothetical protein n=1 Tax=Saccharothrix sp. Mg75 TaxID=3445357 RepID=UPI003EEC46E0
MWDVVRALLFSTVSAVGLFLVANLYSVIAVNASPGSIAMTLRLRGLLRAAPRHVTFRNERGRVLALAYDPAEDVEAEQQVYFTRWPVLSFTRWSGGNRSATPLLRRAAADLVLRVSLFLAVVLPVFGLTGWLAVTVHWTWVYLLVGLAAHHAVVALTAKFVFYKSLGLFAGLLALLVFDSEDWLPFPWEVGVSLLVAWHLVSLGVLLWIEFT